MSQINKNDIISDDALEAPLVLRKNFEQLLDTAKQFIGTAKQYDDSLKTSSKTSEDHRNRTKELTDEQRVLAQITKQVATESAKQSDAYAILSARLRDLKQQSKEKQQIDKEDALLVNAHNSSIEKLTQSITKNRQAYAQLKNEKERNSSEGRKLLSVIQEQDKALQSLHPAIKKAEGNIYLLSAALNKMGEGGVRTNEMLIHITEAMTSGWTLAAAGIGLAAAVLKNFFDTTEEGRIKMEVFEEQTITRWSIFKNKIAEATKAVLDFAEADEQTRKFHEEQRVARMTPEQRKEYEKQLALDKASKDIVLERVKLVEREAEVTEKLSNKRHEALELELTARKSDGDVKTRLDAIVEASKLYNEVNSEENTLLAKRNGLLIGEIYLRAQGRDLRSDELLQIAKLRKEVQEQSNDFISASKRRIVLEAKLRKEINDTYEAEVLRNRESKNNSVLGQGENIADEQKRIKSILESSGVTANADLNKLREDLGKKSLDELKKILEEAKKLREIDAEKQKEQTLELEQRKNEIIQSGANAAVKIVDDQFNHQIAAHDFYLNQTRENYQEEMQIASGNKIAQAQLTKEFRDRERREQQEIIREKRKQAQFERDMTILTIINKTREAAAADLAKYQEAAGPFIAYDITMGAIQEAAVLAKPLPSYDVGVESHPGGFALVHPGELLHYNDQIAFTPDTPSIIDLPKGTQVDTQAETMRLLALAGLSYSVKSDRKEKERIVEQLQIMTEEVKQMRTTREDFHAMMAGYYSFKKESEVFAKRIMIEKFGR